MVECIKELLYIPRNSHENKPTAILVKTWMRIVPPDTEQKREATAGTRGESCLCAVQSGNTTPRGLELRNFSGSSQKEGCGVTVRACPGAHVMGSLGLPGGWRVLCTGLGRIWAASSTWLPSKQCPALWSGVSGGWASGQTQWL